MFSAWPLDTSTRDCSRFTYVDSSILGKTPPPVLLSSDAPGRWSLLISTGHSPIIFDMVYVQLYIVFYDNSYIGCLSQHLVQ